MDLYYLVVSALLSAHGKGVSSPHCRHEVERYQEKPGTKCHPQNLPQ